MNEWTLARVEWNMMVNQAWTTVGNRDHLHRLCTYELCMLRCNRMEKGTEKCVVLRV